MFENIPVAVPMLPTFALPVTDRVPLVLRLPAVAVPATINEVSVPREVTFGWALVVRVPVNRLAVITFDEKLPLVSLATIVAPVSVLLACKPSTMSEFRFETRVVLTTENGAVPIATFEANLLAAVVPVAFVFPITFDVPVSSRVFVPMVNVSPAEP